MTKSILTFSRRTDPAFFMDWLIERVNEGSCTVPNPFSGKEYSIDLNPANVLLLTYWTKNPAAVAPYVESMKEKGFEQAFFITLTGYPGFLEPHTPAFPSMRKAIEDLALKLSPAHLWWRYDPVIITNKLSRAWHIDNFYRLCRDVWKGFTERVIISLVHIDGSYATIRNSLERVCRLNNDKLEMPGYDGFIDLAAEMSKMALEFKIKLEVCCSPKIRENDAAVIKQGACLSSEYIAKIIPKMPAVKQSGTRKGSKKLGYAPCACLRSRDIGILNTCRHGCVYCYANRKR
ncbi:MAG: DUF1848 family protein [Spirochaetales bacterium]|nr:DUF1848 family protein [Spirochaetales bacterium]